ncbi:MULTISPECIES: LysR family transcriptional regulator [Brevibacterium]|jgi:DNA-binding transcriptional LysR family regulator|uniref:LysR family transcriptional regulator n=1 Tax=Brevibacterium salitolerans TaxID=1403566 RepID=A0ABN2WIS5_9MICO|nr:LysR family transcriptional regulator [Brevibacterium sp.]
MLDHRLVVLRTFAVCGTVTAAAAALGYSPSAVSAQLREYQRALGVKLVVKDGRGLRLTAAGAALVERADDLIALWEEVHGQVRAADREVAPALIRLGGFSTATASLLSPVAARLRRDHPSLDVHIIEADPERCVDLLIAERLDLAVIVSMQARPEATDSMIEQVPLLDDPLDVLVPAAHPLAERSAVSLEELAGEPWITDRPGTPYRALFVTAFTSVGATPKVVHQVSDWGSQESLVSNGLGVAFIPRLMRLGSDSGAVRIPLKGDTAPTRRILAVLRRGSRSHQIFAEALDALGAAAREIQSLTAPQGG